MLVFEGSVSAPPATRAAKRAQEADVAVEAGVSLPAAYASRRPVCEYALCQKMLLNRAQAHWRSAAGGAQSL